MPIFLSCLSGAVLSLFSEHPEQCLANSWSSDGHWMHLSTGQRQERFQRPFSRGSSGPRDQTQVSCTAGGFFTS